MLQVRNSHWIWKMTSIETVEQLSSIDLSGKKTLIGRQKYVYKDQLILGKDESLLTYISQYNSGLTRETLHRHRVSIF